MAETPRRNSKKVEQKGRFTITEIISTSPASPQPFSQLEFMESPRQTSENVPKESDTPDQMSGDGIEELTSELPQQVTGLDHRRAKVDNMRDDLRVKRKGRFTIIELASDSTSSCASFDEGDFKTTTTIPRAQMDTTNVSSSTVNPQVSRGLTKSSSDKRLGHKDQADTRRLKGKSMSSIDKQQYMDKTNSSFDGNGTMVGDAAVILHSPVDPNQLPLGSPSLAHAHSFSSLSSETSSTSFDGSTNERRQSLDPNLGRRHLASRQKNNMVTISSAQFQQQQQMISTLVQQQQEFKRMIQVLQEQQQQLVNLPMQLGQLHLGGGGTQDETMEEIVRDLHYQNEALQRENERLHMRLRVTEEEASQLMEENEVLIEMNAELNARCNYLENRFGFVNQNVSMGLSNSMNSTGSPNASPGPSASNSPNIRQYIPPPAPDLQ